MIETIERDAINCLLASRDHIWTRAELRREIECEDAFFDDALAGLQRAGLINCNGEHVILTRAAVRMNDLRL